MNRWTALGTASFLVDAIVLTYLLGPALWSWARRIQIEDVSIGYGPEVMSFRIGPTIVRIRITLLGASMMHAARGIKPVDENFGNRPLPGMRLLEDLSPWERIGIIMSGPAAVMLLCLILLGTRAGWELWEGFGQFFQFFGSPIQYGAVQVKSFLQMVSNGRLREATGLLGAKMTVICLIPFFEVSAGGFIVSEMLNLIIPRKQNLKLFTMLQIVSLLIAVGLFVVQTIAIVHGLLY